MFDKLDAYNLVANLVPGAALTYALHFSGFPTPDPEKIGAFLLVAFVAGVATNRLGSLVLDPLLRCTRFLHPKNYLAFVTSEKQDAKLETLVANSGLYRTFVTAGSVYFLLIGTERVLTSCDVPTENLFIPLVVLGMLVFLFALQKEDGYIHERIGTTDSQTTERGPG